jgi:hypothetical protein
MRETDRQQRIEEIELALASAVESPKSPSVITYDEGATFYMQLAWVQQSHGDTSLDTRCAATLRFSQAQINRYAAMDTIKRRTIQERLKATVQTRFAELKSSSPNQNDCALEVNVDDSLFDVPEEPV